MSGSILTLGLGTFGGVHYLPTLGYLSGAPVPPAPAGDTSTPGFLRKPFILRSRIEREEAPLPVVVPTQPAKPDLEREYTRQSVAIAADVARLRKEADEARAAIAVLEKAQATGMAKRALQAQRDAVARAEAAQAQLFEELEVIDVAYVARAVIGMLH